MHKHKFKVAKLENSNGEILRWECSSPHCGWWVHVYRVVWEFWCLNKVPMGAYLYTYPMEKTLIISDGRFE